MNLELFFFKLKLGLTNTKSKNFVVIREFYSNPIYRIMKKFTDYKEIRTSVDKQFLGL